MLSFSISCEIRIFLIMAQYRLYYTFSFRFVSRWCCLFVGIFCLYTVVKQPRKPTFYYHESASIMWINKYRSGLRYLLVTYVDYVLKDEYGTFDSFPSKPNEWIIFSLIHTTISSPSHSPYKTFSNFPNFHSATSSSIIHHGQLCGDGRNICAGWFRLFFFVFFIDSLAVMREIWPVYITWRVKLGARFPRIFLISYGVLLLFCVPYIFVLAFLGALLVVLFYFRI